MESIDCYILLKERDSHGNFVVIDCDEVWGKDTFVYGKRTGDVGTIVQVPLSNVLYFVRRDIKA